MTLRQAWLELNPFLSTFLLAAASLVNFVPEIHMYTVQDSLPVLSCISTFTKVDGRAENHLRTRPILGEPDSASGVNLASILQTCTGGYAWMI